MKPRVLKSKCNIISELDSFFIKILKGQLVKPEWESEDFPVKVIHQYYFLILTVLWLSVKMFLLFFAGIFIDSGCTAPSTVDPQFLGASFLLEKPGQTERNILSWFQTQVRKTDLPSSGQNYHSVTRVITDLIELILYFRRKKCESCMLLVKTMLHYWALNSQKPGRFPSLKGENTVIDVPRHISGPSLWEPRTCPWLLFSKETDWARDITADSQLSGASPVHSWWLSVKSLESK